VIEGRRVDQWVLGPTGRPYDLGWGTAVVSADESTVTRTCKECRASVTSRAVRVGLVLEVEPVPFVHRPGCTVADRLVDVPRGTFGEF
jgi:hypothetical protein